MASRRITRASVALAVDPMRFANGLHVLEPALLAKLKAGKTLVFIIYRTQEVGVGIPISLAGFDQALAGLR